METPHEFPIKVEHGKIFQEDSLILKEVSFSIRQGEFVYLVGKTGSGKSSLLKSLYGELPLAEGTGEVAGFNLETLKRRQIPMLRRKIGIVFQDFQLLTDRTVVKNLEFVMRATGWRSKKEMEMRVEEVLESVGLSTKGYKKPHQLSGGEQQRVSIARALVNHPEIILADEPTGNLDAETSEGIMNLLFKIAERGTAVFMATHDINIMDRFPARTIKCENQKVIDLKPSTKFNPLDPSLNVNSDD